MDFQGDLPVTVDTGALSRTVQHAFAVRIEAVVQPMGFTLSQWTVMRELRRTPGASASELARTAGHTPQACGAILKQLQADGIVERAAGRGRIVENRLTAHGTAVTDETVTRADAALRPALEHFGREDLDTYLNLAARLLEALNQATPVR
ncbi:MarR family winged helix-turn-helix transcriptional regulator [Streptomyces sp. NBC_01264]|uniref:MarR family winged helix-turn-helix transcriptional regulator n=1 Tax=Streptomyces sp. NBC_01264 TaxID=2903804 RepID=UPI002252C759|nr:MarR family winged helix-turn-helix transcriptional regulator [Streptomyces sp. NBC_01264]MCX4781625.1 MarR family winged helix-turn-helix transcriptional regulator [Streptomyces sp. NBC_01264]